MKAPNFSIGTLLYSIFVLTFLLYIVACKQPQKDDLPNIIIFYTDDQGYNDLSCFGASDFSTPNIDKLAQEGTRFTSFYVSNSVCMPSRASLLTGTYPARNLTTVGLPDTLPSAFHDVKKLDYKYFKRPEQTFFQEIEEDSLAKLILQRDGLHMDEYTIAEILKQKNYKTAMFGKWHLGYFPEFWPGKQGFDYYYGIPYSHDMYPGNNNPWAIENHAYFPPLPLIENDSIIKFDPDFTALTPNYTQKAKKFIQQNKNNPFFIYMAYNLPHVPLAASKKFKKNKANSLYGNVMEEIDWSVGEIINLIKSKNLEQNTLVFFASDNGPWLCYGNHAGKAAPLREGKGTVFEGGVRVPAIIKWPGVIPAGKTYQNPAMTIDILPTIADATNTKVPPHKIDGQSLLPELTGRQKGNSRSYLFYGGGNSIDEREVLAIRKGKWKLVFPHTFKSLNGTKPGMDGQAALYKTLTTDTALYNLYKDTAEQVNVKGKFPEVVKQLTIIAKTVDEEIKANRRPAAYYMNNLYK